MLYFLSEFFRNYWFGFNVFKYITFRAAMAAITAFMISVLFGPPIIRKLKALKIGQNIRKEHVADLHKLHNHKSGTPTMGGLILILAIAASTIAWARMDNRFVILALVTLVTMGAVGFMDDYIKLIKKQNLGLSARAKFIGQTLIALVIGLVVYLDPVIMPTIDIPFFKDMHIDIGYLYILFVMLVVVGSSNAVNLTDGLDGLAIGCVTIIGLTFAGFAYITGNVNMSQYLNVFFLPQGGEMTIVCAAIFGAGLGFLWFNSHPASVFMGDTGSLALGGVIGVISVLLKKELLLVIVGGIFVAEVLSVMLQVLSVKIRRKKLFRMSPLHHHFELGGMDESKVIIRFWIVAIILALVSLSSLKLM